MKIELNENPYSKVFKEELEMGFSLSSMTTYQLVLCGI